MNQELTDKHKKPTHWISALYSISAALAGVGYFFWVITTLLQKANKGISDAVLSRELWSNAWVVIAVLVTALIAGLVNIVFVLKGGRKWTLIPSSIGILISIGAIVFIAIAWMNHGGKP